MTSGDGVPDCGSCSYYTSCNLNGDIVGTCVFHGGKIPLDTDTGNCIAQDQKRRVDDRPQQD